MDGKKDKSLMKGKISEKQIHIPQTSTYKKVKDKAYFCQKVIKNVIVIVLRYMEQMILGSVPR